MKLAKRAAVLYVSRRMGFKATLLFLLSGILQLVSFSAWAGIHRYAVIGDAGVWNASAQQVRDSIVTAGVQSLILPGDNLYNRKTTYEKTWSPWRDAGLRFDVVAIGNHTAGYEIETAFFKMPGEYYTRTDGSSIRFVVLNSDNLRTAEAQARFLDVTLARSSEPFVFVVFHHPSFSITQFHDWKEKEAFHRAILPVLGRHRSKVTALIVGHDHIASLLTFDDLPVIVSGAAHEQRKGRINDYTDRGVRVRTRWLFNGEPMWALLEVNTDVNEARVRFIDATKRQPTWGITLRSSRVRRPFETIVP